MKLFAMEIQRNVNRFFATICDNYCSQLPTEIDSPISLISSLCNFKDTHLQFMHDTERNGSLLIYFQRR